MPWLMLSQAWKRWWAGGGGGGGGGGVNFSLVFFSQKVWGLISKQSSRNLFVHHNIPDKRKNNK